MFRTNLCPFERLSSGKSQNSGDRITTLIMWGLVLVLLFTLANLVFTQVGDFSDYDDASLMGGDITTWVTKYLLSTQLLLGFELGIFITIMRLEYLRGHIGEKRFASQAIRTNNLFLLAQVSKTTLFYSVVFALFSVSVSPGEIFNSWRFLNLCIGSFDQSLLREKF